MTTYRIRIINVTGMYTYGDQAASPELAKLATGNLRRIGSDNRIGVYARETLPGTWTDGAGYAHPRYSDEVLVEAESAPGEWGIPG